ncbi:MAG: rod shape-determining protein MreC [Rikenellaceae bacterium]|nr:rod shape-determining protein MreC [Rikenellaceae bacterium]
MDKLLEFIRSIYVVVVFILLEVAALSYYARSNAYTQARLLTRSNQVVGGVQGLFTSVRTFWQLGAENRRLTEQIIALEEELTAYREAEAEGRLRLLADTMRRLPYYYSTARVTTSSINRTRNFVTIDRGSKMGVETGMALLAANGAMVGHIVSVSKNYAVALTILNPQFQASGKLSHNPDYYGSIRWEGGDYRYVTMDELSKYADIHVGDKVISTGFSDYFPADIPIGEVESFQLNETGTYYTVRVRLAADMSSLSNVILARNPNSPELKGLEAKLKKRYQ